MGMGMEKKYKKGKKVRYGNVEVYEAIKSETNESVYLRELFYPDQSNGVPTILIKQLSFLKQIHHPNILRLVDVVMNDDENGSTTPSVYLVHEKLNMGFDMNTLIDIFGDNFAFHHIIKEMVKQILKGVAYLHVNYVTHLNLSPQNMLINEELDLKITDFGWPTIFDTSSNKYARQKCSYYKAPELILLDTHEEKFFPYPADVWTVGCIFAEMVTRIPLFSASSDLHILCKIFSIMGTPNEETWPGVGSSCPFASIFTECPPLHISTLVPGLDSLGIDLLSKMLTVNPNKRITATAALKHPYFKEAE